jgi:translation initiation factor 2 beta subunit (eIF-2beta)/eIF-5
MKCKHDFLPIFTDKVNAEAVVILTCKKCGEIRKVREYVGNNTPSPTNGSI